MTSYHSLYPRITTCYPHAVSVYTAAGCQNKCVLGSTPEPHSLVGFGHIGLHIWYSMHWYYGIHLAVHVVTYYWENTVTVLTNFVISVVVHWFQLHMSHNYTATQLIFHSALYCQSLAFRELNACSLLLWVVSITCNDTWLAQCYFNHWGKSSTLPLSLCSNCNGSYTSSTTANKDLLVWQLYFSPDCDCWHGIMHGLIIE